MEKIDVKRVEELTSRIEKIDERILAIPREIQAIEEREKQRKFNCDQILADIEKARKEIQRALVSGDKVEPLIQKIKDLKGECELIEYEVLGLKEKAKELLAEKEKLPAERDLCRDDIIRLKLSPLMEEYTRAGEAVSNALRKIFSLMEENNFEFGDQKNQWGRFLTCSSWVGLRIIPRIFPAGKEAGEDFINIAEILTKKNQEVIDKFNVEVRAKRAAKSPARGV